MNLQKAGELLAKCTATAYPEPPSILHTQITERQAPNILSLVPANLPILDVGCGQGPFLKICKAWNREAIGLTMSRDDLGACIAAGHIVHQMDMHELQFPGAYFGLVWARHILEHSPYPMYVLAECHRVLCRGGLCYVEVPAPDTSSQHEFNANHYSVLGDRMWQSLFTRSGFAMESSQEINFVTDLGPDRYYAYLLSAENGPAQQ